MRRAAVSVVSNIAEGQGKLTSGEFQQFLGHSRGSLLELQTQLEIACDLGLLENKAYQTLARVVSNTRLDQPLVGFLAENQESIVRKFQGLTSPRFGNLET